MASACLLGRHRCVDVSCGRLTIAVARKLILCSVCSVYALCVMAEHIARAVISRLTIHDMVKEQLADQAIGRALIITRHSKPRLRMPPCSWHAVPTTLISWTTHYLTSRLCAISVAFVDSVSWNLPIVDEEPAFASITGYVVSMKKDYCSAPHEHGSRSVAVYRIHPSRVCSYDQNVLSHQERSCWPCPLAWQLLQERQRSDHQCHSPCAPGHCWRGIQLPQADI